MKEFNTLTLERFADSDSAEKAFEAAIKCGYTSEEINVMMSEASRNKYYHTELIKTDSDDGTIKGLAIGGAVGGTMGATIGALIGFGSNFVIPGLGIIITGPLAAAGSIYGGLLGSLIGWGIPEENALIYKKGIENGEIILGVKELPERTPLRTVWEPYKSHAN